MKTIKVPYLGIMKYKSNHPEESEKLIKEFSDYQGFDGKSFIIKTSDQNRIDRYIKEFGATIDN